MTDIATQITGLSKYKYKTIDGSEDALANKNMRKIRDAIYGTWNGRQFADNGFLSQLRTGQLDSIGFVEEGDEVKVVGIKTNKTVPGSTPISANYRIISKADLERYNGSFEINVLDNAGNIISFNDLLSKNPLSPDEIELKKTVKLILELKQRERALNSTEQKLIDNYSSRVCISATAGFPLEFGTITDGTTRLSPRQGGVHENLIFASPAWPAFDSRNGERLLGEWRIGNTQVDRKFKVVGPELDKLKAKYKTEIINKLKLEYETARKKGNDSLVITPPSIFIDCFDDDTKRALQQVVLETTNEFAKDKKIKDGSKDFLFLVTDDGMNFMVRNLGSRNPNLHSIAGLTAHEAYRLKNPATGTFLNPAVNLAPSATECVGNFTFKEEKGRGKGVISGLDERMTALSGMLLAHTFGRSKDVIKITPEKAEIISEIRHFNSGNPFSSLTDEEVRFWIAKFEQLKEIGEVGRDKKFSEFLREAFEEVKKTYREGNDGNKENLNGLRLYLSTKHPSIREANIFNPLFDENNDYEELRPKNFNSYMQFLKNGREGTTYRTQQDLAVMKVLFERGFDGRKEEFNTRDGQKLILLTNEKGETFVIGDVGKNSETQNTLQKYIEYLKEKYGETSKTIKILIPQTTGGHWTLLSAVIQLPAGTASDKTTYDSMQEDDPLGLGKRQRDGWSCGIHTMEAVSILINGKSQTQTTETPTDIQREPQPQTPQKRQKPKPSQEQVSSKLVEIAESTSESNPKVSQAIQDLVQGQPSSEELTTLAKPVSLEDKTEETKIRAMKLRAMTVQKAIESGATISNEQASKFIAGEVSDSAQDKDLVEGQLSRLPKEVRRPNQSAKFLCEDKITLNDDGTTTVSLTFDKSQLSLPGGGKCTIKIKLPKGVLASPDLVDALRRKELGEYLEQHTGSSLECDDSNVKTAFEDRFNDRSPVRVR